MKRVRVTCLQLLLLMTSATANNDILYPHTGVLLNKLDGFVTTSTATVNILYEDGIVNGDTVDSCNGKETDLSSIRKKFYEMAVAELDNNGFTYIVDREQFSVNIKTTIAPPLRINGTVGDRVAKPLVPETYDACTCAQDVTAETGMCTCENLAPRTPRMITFPETVVGTLYVNIRYNNVLPVDTAHYINDGNVTVAFLKSRKGVISFSVTSNETTTTDIIHDDNYVYLALESNGTTRLKFSYDISGDYCIANACKDFRFDISISWESGEIEVYEPPLRGDPIPAYRKRRSVFFGLQTQSEVSNSINQALSISQKWAIENKNNVDKLGTLLKQSDLNLNKQSRDLKALYADLCQMGSRATLESNMIKIESSITANLRVMMNLVSQCSIGKVPDTVSYNTLRSICLQNMDLVICDNLGHRMRTIFKCEIKSIHLLSTRFLVQLHIAVPQSFQEEYLLYEIITIPIFSRFGYHHEIKRLDGLTLLRYADRNETVLLTDCETKFEMRICSATQSSDQVASSCISDVINGQNLTQCWAESYLNNADCYVKPYSHGLLVSTAKPLEVHLHSIASVFHSKSTKINGTSVLQNDPDYSRSISCNGVLVQTKLSNPNPIKVQPMPNFNWDASIQTTIDTRLRDNIESDRKQSQNLMSLLNNSLADMSTGFDFEHLDVTGPHRYTIISFIITLTIIAILVIILCCCCCPCCQCLDCFLTCCRCPMAGTVTSYVPNWQFRPRMPSFRNTNRQVTVDEIAKWIDQPSNGLETTRA